MTTEPQYIAVKTVTGKWTVGFFQPDSEWDSSVSAGKRTALLNGDDNAHVFSEPPF